MGPAQPSMAQHGYGMLGGVGQPRATLGRVLGPCRALQGVPKEVGPMQNRAETTLGCAAGFTRLPWSSTDRLIATL